VKEEFMKNINNKWNEILLIHEFDEKIIECVKKQLRSI
jgi:hypothetical protein